MQNIDVYYLKMAEFFLHKCPSIQLSLFGNDDSHLLDLKVKHHYPKAFGDFWTQYGYENMRKYTFY